MKSFRTFLIEAEVLQKDKILLFLNKNKDNPRIAKLLKAFKDGKLSKRQLDGIADMMKNKSSFEKREKDKKRKEIKEMLKLAKTIGLSDDEFVEFRRNLYRRNFEDVGKKTDNKK